jgi:two-component sensor histidine kinase
VLAAMLPLVAILFWNLYSIREAKERDVHAEAFRVGQLAALEMQRLLDGFENTLSAISVAPAVQSIDPVTCNQYVARVSRHLPQFAGIAVLDAQGIIRCRQEPAGIGVSLADKDYVQGALAGKFSVGLYSIGRVSKKPVLAVAVPVEDDNGKIIGAVAASLDLGWLGRRLAGRSYATDSNLTVADRMGVILARHPFPEKFVGTRIPEPYQSLVRAKAPGTIELTSQDGTRRILAYFPPSAAQPGLYVSVGLSTADAYGSVTRATYYGLAVTGVGGGIALLLASLTGRHSIRRPVERLLATVEAWRSHDESARTGMDPKDGEFGRLGAAIDAYMDELVLAREQRRQDEEQRDLLVGELDHRVKNLLATVLAVARQSFKSAGVDAPVLQTFSQRLTAMGEAHSLLMKGQWQSAALHELVETSIRPFDNAAHSQFLVTGPDFRIHSRATLALGMALHELCTNAVKYGALAREDGHVDIAWRVESADGGDRLTFRWLEKNGPPVVPPGGSGFGSTMIERMLSRQVGGEVETIYAPDGFRFAWQVAVAAVEMDG